MDDLDVWMKKYINRYRIQFIENLSTDVFIAGFPGLQLFLRNRANCYFRQDGYFQANTLLLDSIIKIDGFPGLFIGFCEDHDVNPDLVRIVRAGIDEYHLKFGNRPVHQDSQNLAGHRNDHHRGAPLPSAPINGDQSSTSSHNQYVINLSQSTDNSQNASDNVDAANVFTASNNINEGANQRSVSHEDREEITGDVISKENAPTPLECTVSGLTGAEGNTEMNLSEEMVEIPCPCPYHTGVESVVDNNFNENNTRREHGNGLEACSSHTEHVQTVENKLDASSTGTANMQRDKPVPPSCKKKMDKLPTENDAFVYDPNIDSRDPVQKSSYRNKVTFMAEHVTSSGVNVSNDTNSTANETNSARNNGHLTKNNRESNNDNQNVSNNGQSEGTLDSESWESYYLTSSDEEDLLPAQNAADFEIEDLKEIPKLFSHVEESEQRLHSHEVKGDRLQRTESSETSPGTGNNFQRVGPSETSTVTGNNFQIGEPSETSKFNFILRNTGLNGIECQEDLERFNTKAQTEERVENNLLGDENKKHADAKLVSLSVNKKQSKDVNNHIKTNNSSTFISDHHDTVAKTVVSEDTTDNQKPTTCGNATTDNQKPTTYGNATTDNQKPTTCGNATTDNQKPTTYGNATTDNQKPTTRGNATTDNQKPTTYGNATTDNQKPTTYGNDTTDNQKPTTYGNDTTGLNINSSSLTESIQPETELKTVNKMTEAVAQQQACEGNQYDPDDFCAVHTTVATSNIQESVGVNTNLVERNSLPHSVSSSSASAYSVTSEGFQLQQPTSDHASDGSQSFVRETHISALPSTDQSSNFSEPSQHGAENCSPESMENNNSTTSSVTNLNITVLLTLVKIIIELYFPEFNIRL